MAKSSGATKMHQTPHKGHAANMNETAIKPAHGHAINAGADNDGDEMVLGGLTSGSCPPIGGAMAAPNIPRGAGGPGRKGGF